MEISELIAALKQYEEGKGKKASGTPSGPWAHGPGGLFSNVDGEQPILSAMIRPSGLLGRLPVLRADRHVNETVNLLTGQTAGTGSEPSGVCDTPRTAGLLKFCQLVVPFGRQRFRTREWHALRLGKLRDPFEELALTARFPQSLMNRENFVPSAGIPTQGDDVVRTELGTRLFELALEYQRTMGPLVYTASPANNTGDGSDNSGHMESIGLDLWINVDNKRDKLSSALCRAANSFLMDFNYSAVDGQAKSIVQYLTMLYRNAQFNAEKMGLAPATFVFSMNPNLFRMIADVWPCAYMSDRCGGTGGTNIVVVNDERNIEMRNEMYNGKFLWIDGEQVPVVEDLYAPEDNWITNANVKQGEWASDIYLVPMTVLGGMPVTGFQYYDMNEAVRQNSITRNTRIWTTDNGMFLWNSTEVDLCYDMRATTEWRLIMLTPQLAGRLQHVKYAPLQHFRDWDTDGLYHLNGGVTSQAIQTFYNQWSSTPS